MQVPIPEKYGRFEVEKVIGRGAMGVVYLAKDPFLERQVAIKAIQVHPGLSESSVSDLRKRFENEARSAGNLSHPNLVTIFEAGMEDDALYIAMELVEGEAFDDIIESERALSYKEMSDICLQIASALDYAHREGVVHRDIKPANILITRDGQPRITDFGVARQATSNLTATGTIIGTPAYMSPEQITGHKVTSAADQFSLAVILYELLTGSKPFLGDSTTTILYKVVHEEPASPGELRNDLPKEVDGVLLRGLAKSAEDRYESCMDLVEAVREALGAAPSDAASVLTGTGVMRSSDEESLAAKKKGSSDPRAATRVARDAEAARGASASALSGVLGKLQGDADTLWKSPAALGAGGGVVAILALLGFVVFGGGSSDAPASPDPAVATAETAQELLPEDDPTGGLDALGDDTDQILAAIDAAIAERAATLTVDALLFDVVTVPPGATVVMDGQAVEGETPMQVAIDPQGDHALEIRLAGHKAQSWRFSVAGLTEEQRDRRRLFFPLRSLEAPIITAPAASAIADDVFAAQDTAPSSDASPETPEEAEVTDPPPDYGRPVRPGADIEPPRVIEKSTPDFPDWADEEGLPIYVILELVIDQEGNVREAMVLRSVHPSLEEIAIASAMTWQIEPATRDGQPVAAYYNVTVQFKK